MAQDVKDSFQTGTLSLGDAIALGTGVMIGAGIFALTGQIAGLAGGLFPAAFLAGAAISMASAYGYMRVTARYPDAGGIGTILHRAYGHGSVTGGAALLMALSMIINESLVARTFATYTLQLVGIRSPDHWAVPVLAVSLVFIVFLINLSGNRLIGGTAKVTAGIKVVGIALFAGVALYASGGGWRAGGRPVLGPQDTLSGFLAASALAVLAYKGFTTITNSGSELVDPHRNVGRAIAVSLGLCLGVYLLVAWAVGANLTIDEIVAARDYALAEAARPLLGEKGVWFTVGIAIVATASGLMASMFAVSRLLTMLTEKKLIPHRHFGMPGGLHKHLVVYTAVLAGLLAAFFDLGRIAALGAIFYLVMDVIIQWGILGRLRRDVDARAGIVACAIFLDLLVLAALVRVKIGQDLFLVVGAAGTIAAVFALEAIFLRTSANRQRARDSGTAGGTH